MKKIIRLALTLLTLLICKNSFAQVFENYSVYSFAPGISSACEGNEYSGFSMIFSFLLINRHSGWAVLSIFRL